MALPGFEDSGRIAEDFRGLGVSRLVQISVYTGNGVQSRSRVWSQGSGS